MNKGCKEKEEVVPHEEHLDAWGYAEKRALSPSPHGPSDLNIQEDNLI